MSVLVTGGGGFLGLYIVELLVQGGAQVRSFSRREHAALGELGVEQTLGDIRDAAAVSQACRGIELVIHTAAVAGIWGPWRHYYAVNTEGTCNVLAACRQHGVARLVYTSSPSVTFDGSDQCGVDETVPYSQRWLCHYPHSKALAEQEVLAADCPGELRTCALRPHLIWGPRDEHLIPRLLDRARAGKLLRIGDGTNLIDMVYVENAASAHLQAAEALRSAETPVGGRAYFISQGAPVNCWDWINEILDAAGIPPISRSIPLGVAWRLGGLMELGYRLTGRQSEPRMTRFLAAQLATSHYFDVTRARQDFGYTPQVSTAEGMGRLANWCATR
jgi:nucleoside-diphosphate-sugar epimerase